jgi:hypothetical protein
MVAGVAVPDVVPIDTCVVCVNTHLDDAIFDVLRSICHTIGRVASDFT